VSDKITILAKLITLTTEFDGLYKDDWVAIRYQERKKTE